MLVYVSETANQAHLADAEGVRKQQFDEVSLRAKRIDGKHRMLLLIVYPHLLHQQAIGELIIEFLHAHACPQCAR